MGKGSGGAPSFPDPTTLIAAQEAANRVNVFTPYGSQMFGESYLDDQGNLQFRPSETNAEGDPQRAFQIVETPFQAQQRQAYEQLAGTLGSTALGIGQNLSSNFLDLNTVDTPYQPGIDRSGFPAIQTGVQADPLVRFLGTEGLPGLQTVGGGPRLQTDLGDPGVGVRTNLNLAGLPALPGVGDFSGDAMRQETATFQRGMNRLNPVIEQQNRQTLQRLADSGLPVGSEAYDSELERLSRQQNEAVGNLALDSVGAGRQEQSRLFGLASQARGQAFGEQSADAQLQNAARQQLFGELMGRGQFGNQALQQMFGNEVTAAGVNNAARGQGFQEALAAAEFANRAQNQAFQQGLANASLGTAARGMFSAEALQDMQLNNASRDREINEQLMVQNQGVNLLSQLLGASPSFPMPNFGGASPIDVMGPYMGQYQAAANAYNQGQANNRAMLGGLFQLGGAAMGIPGLF